MLARLVPVLLLAGCGAAGPPGVYRTLATEAMDPAARVAIVGLVATDRHPAGIPITEAHRRDPDPEVRRLCYAHLITVDGERAESWLREALDDPVEGVRVAGVLRADRVPEWSDATWLALWRALESATLGHVFDRAAYAVVARGGIAAAHRVYDLVLSRGPAWSDFAVRALTLEPDERFRGAFERASGSADPDVALLGRRGLVALERGAPVSVLEPAELPAEMTVEEWYAHWRDEGLGARAPEVIGLADVFLEACEARAVVVGELHAFGAGRAMQIALLTELIQAHGGALVAVFETPVLEYQRPVMEVAELYGVEVRLLEDEELGREGAAPVRDEFARAALASMVEDEPERRFVVFYGENHRRSLTAAVRDVGVRCASVATYPADGMLGAAMRVTDGDIVGRAFRFGDGSLFVASASYAVLTGCAALDRMGRGR